MLPSRRIEPLLDPPPELPISLADNILLSRRFLRHHPPQLRGAAFRLLRRASGRRMMLREPSVRVRENAAEQLEERQSDWAYSKPIIILDVLWNLAFVVVAAAVLCMSSSEEPEVPLRLWVVGYAIQCLFHIGCMVFEYYRRMRTRGVIDQTSNLPRWARGNSNSGSGSGDRWEFDSHPNDDNSNVVKYLESANTLFSFVWWLVGFFWISVGGQNIILNSPQLYWLCITFLAFDVLFVIICVAVACLVGIAVCCCLPCIIGVLYAITDREGAAAEDIERLPTFRFRRGGGGGKPETESQEPGDGTMIECDTDSPIERRVSVDAAECCICLQTYEDEAELMELPCHHHFHATCIEKWLYMNATCPLCKLNILKFSSSSDSDDA